MPPTPSAFDLTTLAAVKSWAEVPNTNVSDDTDIQDAITGFSTWMLKYTGMASLNTVAQYTELRNGNGNFQMFTRNRPIVSVISITVSGATVPAAGAWPSAGYFIADDGRSIWLRGTQSPASFGTYFPQVLPSRVIGQSRGFVKGIGNVQLVYTAGYNGTPSDLEFAVRRAVSLNYKRKGWQGLKKKGQVAGTGQSSTTEYTEWKVPPEIMEVFEFYRRIALIT